jgi:hypothetical protein
MAANALVSGPFHTARRFSHATVAAAAAALQTRIAAGEIGAPIRSTKYEMMIGEAMRESAEAARTSAPVSVAVSMIAPGANSKPRDDE